MGALRLLPHTGHWSAPVIGVEHHVGVEVVLPVCHAVVTVGQIDVLEGRRCAVTREVHKGDPLSLGTLGFQLGRLGDTVTVLVTLVIRPRHHKTTWNKMSQFITRF